MSAAIALIDESRLFREGLRRICEDWPFQIGLEASSFADLECDGMSGEAPAPKPDLVLIDTPQDGRALREELVRVREQFPDARLVVLTDHMKLDRLAIAMAAGVDGYLLKNLSGAALLQSLRLVLQGEKVFPTLLAELLVNGRIAVGADFMAVGRADADPALSNREREILQCLANGYSNKKIANVLELTESRVKGHLKALLRRIRVQNRTQAAIWALNHGVGVDVAELTDPAGRAPDEDRSLDDAECDAGTDASASDERGYLARRR